MEYSDYQRQSPQILLSSSKMLLEKHLNFSFDKPIIQPTPTPNLMNKMLPFMKKKKSKASKKNIVDDAYVD